MKRREAIALIGGVACWPLCARGQPTARNPRIGFLYGGVAEALTLRANAFLEGVRSGERRNVDLVPRAAGASLDRLPVLAAELAGERLDVLFVTGPAGVRAAHAAARATPIVALDLETDPVATGLVSSLSKPGGNLTGIFFDFPDFSTKWLELMRAVLPDLSRVAVLWDPGTGPLQLQGLRKAAAIMAVELRVIEVKSVDAMHQAFADARAESVEGAVILSSPIFGSNPARTAELALEHRLPCVSLFPEFAFSGGLLAYGPYVSDLYRQSGQIVAKVLAGTPPGELPIERPAKFQLVVNVKTARALGIEVPRALLLLADEVIE
jgi:putative tryptophan/tyrosine transport system substrate-binding protein